MAFSEFHLSADNSLQRMVSFIALTPEGKEGPFPVLYLLHGLSDDYTAWTRRTSIERYVQDLPLIVIMPDGDRSFYCDAQSRPAGRFETFVTHDLIRIVDATFRTIPARDGRAIAGLSMGGYGAMKNALKFPDLYCAGISYSGALLAASRNQPPEWSLAEEWRTVFGESPPGGPNDILAVSTAIERAKLPGIWIDCGSEDFLIKDTRAFHEHLLTLNIAHEYAEHTGEHTWEFWDQALLRTLAWLMARFGQGVVSKL
jgi:S-formylglutathione hydrolase FrmB